MVKKMKYVAISLIVGASLLPFPTLAALQNCGSLENAYGPYDYTNPADQREHLPIVEKGHFTSNVENLIRGQTGTRLMPDLDYTLRAFPNHHRALYSMMQLQLRSPAGSDSRYYTAECYFIRATRFAPKDPVPYMLFGIYYEKSGDLPLALEKYLEAYAISPSWVDLNYNLGLLYLELGEEEKALKHAKYAYEHGFVLQGLKDMLARRGLWNDTAPKE